MAAEHPDPAAKPLPPAASAAEYSLLGIPFRLRGSALALVAANLVPVYGVLALGWQVGSIMAFFWTENLVIGLFNILKMAVAKGEGSSGRSPAMGNRIASILFFTVHYGMFTFGHGCFLVGLFDLDWRKLTAEIGLAFTVLLASHSYSFARQFIGGGEYREFSFSQLFMQPYQRVWLMHLSIILGGILATALNLSLGILLALVALKTTLDLRAHARQH
jgi:uncharacterized membrane protein YiaA